MPNQPDFCLPATALACVSVLLLSRCLAGNIISGGLGASNTQTAMYVQCTLNIATLYELIIQFTEFYLFLHYLYVCMCKYKNEIVDIYYL